MSKLNKIKEVQLAGVRALVTGASSGLGYRCALALGRRGAIVALVARRRNRLAKVQAEVRSLGGQTLIAAGDMTQIGQIRELCNSVDKQLGGIDIIVNSAAVYMEGTELVACNLMDWTRIMNTNLRAPYLLCRTFVPGMVERGYGRVVNVLSATSDLGGAGPYRISKIGLEVLTAVLSKELQGTGVAAFGINPGWMRTEMSEAGRSPTGAARAIVDLLDLDGDLPNGEIFDLRWRGRKFYLRRRRARRGRFGL